MTTSELLLRNESICLVGKAHLRPVAGLHRFQPAGFPEIGHVLYDATDVNGHTQKVCIVDSAASMANHLEKVSLAEGDSLDLHEDLAGLPYVACIVEDGTVKRQVCTTLTEGHRLASDYFVGPNATLDGRPFREILRNQMNVKELQKDKKYWIYPDSWGDIYKTIFRYDPNSLVHGLLFTREEIKISRILTAHHEAPNADRVRTSGVKFDKLGKTLSGQPIFSVDEETANGTIATFTLDLGLVRSYGRNTSGLRDNEKQLLIDLALWKISRLTDRPFRFRSGCHLERSGSISWTLDGEQIAPPAFDIKESISRCKDSFGPSPTRVEYPAAELFRVEEKDKTKRKVSKGQPPEEGETH